MEARCKRADEVLRAAKRRDASPRAQVERGLAGDRGGGALAGWVAELVGPPERRVPWARAFGRLLAAALAARSRLLDAECHVAGLARLAEVWHLWVEPPEGWAVRTHSPARQFASLARRLLARYPVPAFFDSVWLETDPLSVAGRRWFAHVGRGGNLRSADGLPFPLTRQMAHHVMRADPSLTLAQALRWGQLVGLGVAERTASAAATGTRLRAPLPDEDFWLTFARFLANHPMLDPRQVGPVVDYVWSQRFEPVGRVCVGGTFHEVGPPQPRLSMKGRTAESLLRQVNEWHRRLGKEKAGRMVEWPGCGAPGWDRIEGTPGNERRFVVVELLNNAALVQEGRAMKHCVFSYVNSCARGHAAIFSLQSDEGRGRGLERLATIEVDTNRWQIVQARGRLNAKAGPLSQRVIRAWAVGAGLEIGKGVW